MTVRRPRGTWLRALGGLAAVLVLWTIAYQTFTDQPPARPGGKFRVDRGEAVAYPLSDAGCYFQNALAILSGDGWVNWRHTNRWSVYAPGWSLFLAGLAELSGRHLPTMQTILTLLLAGVIPLVALLVTVSFPGRGAPVLAVATALLFLLHPPDGSWWFQRTMMTEGPMLLLSVLVCLLGVRFCSRPRWRWEEGLVLGLAAGAACLVRSQGRLAVAGVLAVLLLAATRKTRSRLPFLAFFLAGVLAVVGPLYLKTSYHLDTFYAGTSYLDLHAVLDWSPAGRRIGGAALDLELARRDEAAAIRGLEERAWRAVRENWREPWPPLRAALVRYRDYTLGSLAKAFRTTPGDLRFLVPAVLLALTGLAFGLLRRGSAVLVPVAYTLGYMGPMVAFSYYFPRFGVPVSFLGPVLVTGGVVVLTHPGEAARAVRRARAGRVVAGRKLRDLRRLLRSSGPPGPGARSEKARRARPWTLPARLALLAVALWVLAATAYWIREDLSPLPPVDPREIVVDPVAREALRKTGTAGDPVSAAGLDAAIRGGGRILAGVAHLPWTMEPGDSPFPNPWATLQPFRTSYTAFFVASPWKEGGSFDLYLVTVPGTLYPEFRHGDRVLAVLAAGGPAPPATSAFPGVVPTVHAEAVIPIGAGAP